MSEIIVRMEMPKRCFDCPMHDWTYGLHETRQNVLVCNAHHELTPILCQTIPGGNERPDWCPIVGVLPEGHGRLIDEAVFCENVVKYSHQSTKTIGKALDATPTILDMTLIDTERSKT